MRRGQSRCSKQTMKAARLPQHMEKHSQARGLRVAVGEDTEPAAVAGNPHLTFRPVKPLSVPDFPKEHKRFEAQLRKRRRFLKATECRPFKIKDSAQQPARRPEADPLKDSRPGVPAQSARRPVTDPTDLQPGVPAQPGSSICPPKSGAVGPRPRPATSAPKMTQKAVAQLQATVKLKEESAKAQLARQAAEEARAKEQAERARRFREKCHLVGLLTVDDKLGLLTREKQREGRQREQQYREQLEGMRARLEERQSYLERLRPQLTKRQLALDQVKALLSAFELFVTKNPDSDFTKVFSKQEMKLVREGRFLKRQGFLK